MPRNHRYIAYYKGRRHQYKLVIQPAGDGAPSSWVDTILPENVIIFSQPESLPHLSFGDRPLSMQEMPVWKFGVNLHKLKGGVDTDENGTTDLEDLHYYLLHPGYENGGKLYYTNVATIASRFFNTRNVWRFYTDLGDGEEPDTLLFEGVQQPDKEKPGEAVPFLGTNTMEIEVDHILLPILEAVLPVDIATRTLNDGGDFRPALPPDGVMHDRVWDYVWRSAPWTHGVAYYEKGQHLTFMPLWCLYYAIQRLVNDVYISFLRTGEDPRSVWRFKLRSLKESHLVYAGMPYDVLTFYQRDYLPGNGRGAELNNDDVCFIDRIARTTSFAEDQIVGGFLSEHNQDASIYAYSNALQFLRQCSTLCKAQLDMHEEGLDLWFLPLRYNRTGSRILTIRDVKSIGSDSIPRIPYIQAARVVGNVQFAVKGGEGDDRTSDGVNAIPGGGSADSGPNIDLAFHTMPRVGSKLEYKDTLHILNNSNLTSNPASISTGYFNPLVLVYVANPGTVLTRMSPIRVHESVTLDLGDGTVMEDEGYTTIGNLPGKADTVFGEQEEWYSLIRAYALESQKVGGLPHFAAAAIGALFGDEAQMHYKMLVPIEKALPNYHGEVYEFRDQTGTTPIGANILGEPGETKFSGLKGMPHLMTATYDIVNDLAEVELFAS